MEEATPQSLSKGPTALPCFCLLPPEALLLSSWRLSSEGSFVGQKNGLQPKLMSSKLRSGIEPAMPTGNQRNSALLLGLGEDL